MPMTEDIAAFAATFSLKTAPAELLPRVRETFLDSFGVMLAGSGEESAQITARWVRSQGEIGQCTVIAERDLRTSPVNGALANGVAAQALRIEHHHHAVGAGLSRGGDRAGRVRHVEHGAGA